MDTPTGNLRRIPTKEQMRTLALLAREAVYAECFGFLPRMGNWTNVEGEASPKWVPVPPDEAEYAKAHSRAFLILLAAYDSDINPLDALNWARVENGSLVIAFPGPTATEVFRLAAPPQPETLPVAPSAPAPARPAGASNSAYDAAFIVPKGFTAEGKLMGDLTVGELAYFVEETKDKTEAVVRNAAWRVLSDKLSTASALDLGKLIRWLNAKTAPEWRKKTFMDVLVIAERRLEALGTGSGGGA